MGAATPKNGENHFNLNLKFYTNMKRFTSFIKALSLVLILFSGATAIASVGNELGNSQDIMASLCVGGVVTVSCIILQYTKKPANRNGFITNDFTEGLCADIQVSMNETFKANSPEIRRTKVGFLQAIKSPQNTSGFKVIPIDNGDGKIKGVRITGIVRGCEEDVIEDCIADADRTCVGDKIVEPWEDFISVDDFACIESPAFSFSEADMRRLCEGDDSYRARVINANIDPVTVRLNKLLITDQNANFGKFYDGSLIKTVDLLKAGTLAPVYIGEAQILDEFELLELNVKPIVIGSGRLGNYVRQIGIGCCNDGGINLAQAGNLDFFRDKYVEDIIGVNEFIGLAPGHVMLLTFNTNVGSYRRVHDHYINDTFVDPRTGIKWDIDVTYDPCKRTYYMKFRLKYLLYRMPTKAFAYCDELYETNGTLNFLAGLQA